MVSSPVIFTNPNVDKVAVVDMKYLTKELKHLSDISNGATEIVFVDDPTMMDAILYSYNRDSFEKFKLKTDKRLLSGLKKTGNKYYYLECMMNMDSDFGDVHWITSLDLSIILENFANKLGHSDEVEGLNVATICLRILLLRGQMGFVTEFFEEVAENDSTTYRAANLFPIEYVLWQIANNNYNPMEMMDLLLSREENVGVLIEFLKKTSCWGALNLLASDNNLICSVTEVYEGEPCDSILNSRFEAFVEFAIIKSPRIYRSRSESR